MEGDSRTIIAASRRGEKFIGRGNLCGFSGGSIKFWALRGHLWEALKATLEIPPLAKGLRSIYFLGKNVDGP